jgi:hypothetical protein
VAAGVGALLVKQDKGEIAMLFFVELPADEYGNRAYTNAFPCVVEAEIRESELSGEILWVIAPPEIATKWQSIHKASYGGWLECEGPARSLTRDEREELIVSLRR